MLKCSLQAINLLISQNLFCVIIYKKWILVSFLGDIIQPSHDLWFSTERIYTPWWASGNMFHWPANNNLVKMPKLRYSDFQLQATHGVAWHFDGWNQLSHEIHTASKREDGFLQHNVKYPAIIQLLRTIERIICC